MKKLIWILAAIICCTMVMALPIEVEELKVDGTVIESGDNVRFDLERNDEIDIKVTLLSEEDVDDVQMKVFISGYEYNDFEPIEDETSRFSMDANVTYIKRLTINLPDEMEEDDYKLRLIISDRNNEMVTMSYPLKIDVPRHKLKIEDIVFYPGGSIESGKALLTSVRIENKGEIDEDDVKVIVSIPELGLRGSDYIEEIEYSDEEESEEIFLRIPDCTEAKDYEVIVIVEYDNGHEEESMMKVLTVLNDEKSYVQVEEKIITPIEPVVEPVVEPVKDNKVRTVLEVVLIVLLIILVIIGLLVGISKLRENNEDF